MMPYECDVCGESFTTLSRLRLHDCLAEEPAELNPLLSFDSFLDSISDALDVDMERRNQEREKWGLEVASGTLKTNLEAAAKGDVNAAPQMFAYYEQELQEYHQTENDDTYRGIFWAFYEPAAEMLDEIVTREGWPFLTGLIDAYSHESGDELLVSPVIENAAGRHVVRTWRRDGVGAVPAKALAYFGSFWDSNKDTSREESFTHGWGIGYPEHSAEEQLQDAATEGLFWAWGVLSHAFYADQYTTADLMDALLSDERIGYEDRYLLTSILSEVDRDSAPKVPRYWDMRDELNDRFEFNETVKSQLWNTIESEGLHRQLREEWAFVDMDLQPHCTSGIIRYWYRLDDTPP